MSANPKPAPAQKPTLAVLARETLRAADGNTDMAVDVLTSRLLADRSLLRGLLAEAVGEAVETTVGMAHRHTRAAIIRSATSGRDAVVSLASGISAALLDLPLAGGVRLREATREQVVAQADRYEALSTDMGRKARWLRLIAQRVPDDTTVGSVVNEARALELWNEVSR